MSMVYYGLSLNTGNLGGNFYLNFTISGLVEFPAYTLCILLLNRMGRKWLHCACMVLGGLACLSTVFTSLYASEGMGHLLNANVDFDFSKTQITYFQLYIDSTLISPNKARTSVYYVQKKLAFSLCV